MNNKSPISTANSTKYGYKKFFDTKKMGDRNQRFGSRIGSMSSNLQSNYYI